METYTTTEFVLPGVAMNPANRMKTALMGIWHRTLDDLTADNGQLGIIPQFMLWYLPRNDDEDDEHDDDDEDEPEDDEDEPEDDEDGPEDDEDGPEDDEDGPEEDGLEDDEDELEDEDDESDTANQDGKVDNGDTKSEASHVSNEDEQNAGDLSLVSIAATVAQKDAREVLPDFAVIFHRYRTIQNGPNPRYRIRYFGVPILAEQKRPPGRKLVHDEGFYEKLVYLIWQAKVAVSKQAAHLFRMHTEQRQTLTFACSGIYWSYRIVQRETVMHLAGDGDDDYQEEEEEEEEDDVDVDDEDLEENDDDVDRDVGDLSRVLEPVVSDDELEYPNDWSRILKLDSPASNQHLCLIWAYVNSINDANRTMG